MYMYVYVHEYVICNIASIIVPVALSASSCYSLQSTPGGKEEASTEPQTPDH